MSKLKIVAVLLFLTFFALTSQGCIVALVVLTDAFIAAAEGIVIAPP